MSVVVRLVTEETKYGQGKRRRWRAEDFARDLLGVDRKRKTAIRKMRPAEELV